MRHIVAKSKLPIAKAIDDAIKSPLKVLKNKRDIDFHRDEFGNLENVEIDFDIDDYTLKGLSLKGSKLKGVFNNIKGQGVDFSNATLDVTFKNSDLRWATFTAAQREKNIFENCNLREINVIG